MEENATDFFASNPEGAVFVALDSREEGALFGTVELRKGEEVWLDYELEPSLTGDMVSLFRGAEDTPALKYCVRGRRVDTVAPPERLLVYWNRGRRTLAVDGEPLLPGEITASAPQGVTPWLLRFAGWMLAWP